MVMENKNPRFLGNATESYVSTAPPGPGNSGIFNFLVFKALLKARHCGVRFLLKYLPRTRVPKRQRIMWNRSRSCSNETYERGA